MFTAKTLQEMASSELTFGEQFVNNIFLTFILIIR